MPTIDLDRGVTKRPHSSGIVVVMYKDTPGEYFDATGNPVTSELAEQAGFPVEEHATEMKKAAALAQARAAVEAEFAAKSDLVNQVLSASVEGQVYVLKKGKGDNYSIVNKESGEALTPYLVDKSTAQTLMQALGATTNDVQEK